MENFKFLWHIWDKSYKKLPQRTIDLLDTSDPPAPPGGELGRGHYLTPLAIPRDTSFKTIIKNITKKVDLHT